MSGVRAFVAVVRVVFTAPAQADECERYRQVLLTWLRDGVAVHRGLVQAASV